MPIKALPWKNTGQNCTLFQNCSVSSFFHHHAIHSDDFEWNVYIYIYIYIYMHICTGESVSCTFAVKFYWCVASSMKIFSQFTQNIIRNIFRKILWISHLLDADKRYRLIQAFNWYLNYSNGSVTYFELLVYKSSNMFPVYVLVHLISLYSIISHAYHVTLYTGLCLYAVNFAT